jgi:hypothetical protein
MPLFVFALVFNFVAHLARSVRRDSRKAKPESLCAECFHAHVQYGANARRSISCAYGGVVRPVKLDVLYCTDYQSRVQPAPRAIGFVYQIAPCSVKACGK